MLRSFDTVNVGSVGQRAAKLLAFKVGGQGDSRCVKITSCQSLQSKKVLSLRLIYHNFYIETVVLGRPGLDSRTRQGLMA